MASAGRPRALHVMFFGGLAAATLDIINALLFWHLHNGAAPVVILQAIAAGLLGPDAFAGRKGAAALGLLLHYLIAFGMAAAYWGACLRWPALIRHWIGAGLAYGVLTWFAMNYVVVPLSLAQTPRFNLPWFIDGLLAHILLVGLLLAFVARWSANRR